MSELSLQTKGPYDLLVVGGGINGAGIARDAAGRGLKVLMCEQGDLAQGTSSASTKLIHGGLRYLEHFEFRLVREALIEREVLLRAAPHIIWPLTFVLPHTPGLRPAWMLRLGLWLYDHLGGRRQLPGSRALDLRRDPLGAPLSPSLTRGFTYADCWVEDSRLVVLNALDARERGAEVMVGTRLVSARRDGALWHAQLDGREQCEVTARALINAAGPWVQRLLGALPEVTANSHLRLIKGSHIVVPRLISGEQAYIFQNDDQRVVFVIPYQNDYSLIGTTEVAFEGAPDRARISVEETDYLCRAVNRYLKRPVAGEDVVWSFSGVRPLYDDAHAKASAVTRDYVLEVDGEDDQAPLLSVFGGKITTYRKLAEAALEKLAPQLGRVAVPWTQHAVLPGGDLPNGDFAGYVDQLTTAFPWLPAQLAHRYARAYGTRAERVLSGRTSLEGLGRALGEGLYEAEVEYLMSQEWARTADDVLWRRSKLGLHLSDGTHRRLGEWIADQRGSA